MEAFFFLEPPLLLSKKLLASTSTWCTKPDDIIGMALPNADVEKAGEALEPKRIQMTCKFFRPCLVVPRASQVVGVTTMEGEQKASKLSIVWYPSGLSIIMRVLQVAWKSIPSNKNLSLAKASQRFFTPPLRHPTSPNPPRLDPRSFQNHRPANLEKPKDMSSVKHTIRFSGFPNLIRLKLVCIHSFMFSSFKQRLVG